MSDVIGAILMGVLIGGVLVVLYYEWYSKPDGSIPSECRSEWDKNRIWKAFSPESFEWLIGEYFLIDSEGDVDVKQASRDKGVDVVLRTGRRRKTSIQAKRYKPGENKVGAPTVRKTVGAAQQQGSNKVVIVTTSSFTSPAQEARDELSSTIEIELIDGTELEHRLNRTNLTPPWPPEK